LKNPTNLALEFVLTDLVQESKAHGRIKKIQLEIKLNERLCDKI